MLLQEKSFPRGQHLKGPSSKSGLNKHDKKKDQDLFGIKSQVCTYVRTITHWAFLAARTLDHNFKSKNSHFQLSGLKHCFQQEKEGEKEAS